MSVGKEDLDTLEVWGPLVKGLSPLGAHAPAIFWGLLRGAVLWLHFDVGSHGQFHWAEELLSEFGPWTRGPDLATFSCGISACRWARSLHLASAAARQSLEANATWGKAEKKANMADVADVECVDVCFCLPVFGGFLGESG